MAFAWIPDFLVDVGQVLREIASAFPQIAKWSGCHADVPPYLALS